MADVRIILVRPRNPENIGAAARAAANFGITDFAVVQPYGPSWQESRAAVGGAALLKKARKFETVAEAVADRDLVIGTTAGGDRKLDLPGYYLPELTKRLKRKAGKKIAVLFGSEKTGLANDELETCRWIVTIPTSPEVPSMNLGQAVALVCYELAREVERPRTPLRAAMPPPMALEQVERLTILVDEVLRGTGYFAALHEQLRRAQIRRALLRWELRAPDEYLLNGGLRWVLKKLK